MMGTWTIYVISNDFELALFAWLISHQPAVLFSQNKSVTSKHTAVLVSQNTPAPDISHQPNEQAHKCFSACMNIREFSCPLT
jgi:hypothetical protein